MYAGWYCVVYTLMSHSGGPNRRAQWFHIARQYVPALLSGCKSVNLQRKISALFRVVGRRLNGVVAGLQVLRVKGGEIMCLSHKFVANRSGDDRCGIELSISANGVIRPGF